MIEVIDNSTINIPCGDTGAIRIKANAKYRGTDNPYTFGERDRALFTLKTANGTIVKQKVYPLVNNTFTVVFLHDDTKNYNGVLRWDVRYFINPHYIEGDPIPRNGDQIETPKRPMDGNIYDVVGDI